MGNRKIPLEEATYEQLKQFAKNILFLELPGNPKKDDLLASIAEAWNQDHIVIHEEDHPARQSVEVLGTSLDTGEELEVVRLRDAPQPPRRVRVLLQAAQGKRGKDPIPVNVNGRTMYIPRGQACEIPFKYYEALRHAVRWEYEMDEDEKHMNPTPIAVPNYPFQLLPTQAMADYLMAMKEWKTERDEIVRKRNAELGLGSSGRFVDVDGFGEEFGDAAIA